MARLLECQARSGDAEDGACRAKFDVYHSLPKPIPVSGSSGCLPNATLSAPDLAIQLQQLIGRAVPAVSHSSPMTFESMDKNLSRHRVYGCAPNSTNSINQQVGKKQPLLKRLQSKVKWILFRKIKAARADEEATLQGDLDSNQSLLEHTGSQLKPQQASCFTGEPASYGSTPDASTSPESRLSKMANNFTCLTSAGTPTSTLITVSPAVGSPHSSPMSRSPSAQAISPLGELMSSLGQTALPPTRPGAGAIPHELTLRPPKHHMGPRLRDSRSVMFLMHGSLSGAGAEQRTSSSSDQRPLASFKHRPSALRSSSYFRSCTSGHLAASDGSPWSRANSMTRRQALSDIQTHRNSSTGSRALLESIPGIQHRHSFRRSLQHSTSDSPDAQCMDKVSSLLVRGIPGEIDVGENTAAEFPLHLLICSSHSERQSDRSSSGQLDRHSDLSYNNKQICSTGWLARFPGPMQQRNSDSFDYVSASRPPPKP